MSFFTQNLSNRCRCKYDPSISRIFRILFLEDFCNLVHLWGSVQPKNTCHQLDSGTIRLGDGTACSEGRLNINKILAPCEVPLRLPFPQAGKQLLNSWSSFKVKLIDDDDFFSSTFNFIFFSINRKCEIKVFCILFERYNFLFMYLSSAFLRRQQNEGLFQIFVAFSECPNFTN